MRTLGAACILTATLSIGWDRDEGECGWTQWGRDAANRGMVCRPAQKPESTLAQLTFDPFSAQEQADDPTGRGDLLAHDQAPLVDDDDVFMMTKTGSWISCSTGAIPCGPRAWSSQIWNEKRFQER